MAASSSNALKFMDFSWIGDGESPARSEAHQEVVLAGQTHFRRVHRGLLGSRRKASSTRQSGGSLQDFAAVKRMFSHEHC